MGAFLTIGKAIVTGVKIGLIASFLSIKIANKEKEMRKGNEFIPTLELDRSMRVIVCLLLDNVY